MENPCPLFVSPLFFVLFFVFKAQIKIHEYVFIYLIFIFTIRLLTHVRRDSLLFLVTGYSLGQCFISGRHSANICKTAKLVDELINVLNKGIFEILVLSIHLIEPAEINSR